MNSGCEKLRVAARKGASWLSGGGADADVVISSRVRMARNLAGFPFVTKATRQQRLEILARCQKAMGRVNGAGPSLARSTATASKDEVLWVDVHDVQPLDRTLMVERHLISKEHARGILPGAGEPDSGERAEKNAGEPEVRNEPRAVAVSLPDESVSIMVNEEDHLRLQAMLPGLELSAAFCRINEVDDRLESSGADGSDVLQFAYSSRFGYLTCCPTNVGTGVRVSVMLHLPALKLTGEIEKVKRATRDMSIAVRGYYGEGSEATGDLYQISNQTTLGKPESVILHEIEREIVPQIIGYERAARKTLVDKRRRTTEDKVFRSLGTLRHARLLTPDEAVTLLSDVRLGVVSGLVDGIELQTVNQLILLTQPAHLQMAMSREMDQGSRREARADFVRQRLGSS